MIASSQKHFPQMFMFFVIFMFVFFTGNLPAIAAQVVVIPLVGTPTAQTSSISPTDVLDLGTTEIAPDTIADVSSVTPTGSLGGVYTVPADKYLVITSVNIFPSFIGTGKIKMKLLQNTVVRKLWIVPNAQPTHLSFGPGLLIAPGSSLEIKNVPTSDGPVRVSLYGYLTD